MSPPADPTTAPQPAPGTFALLARGVAVWAITTLAVWAVYDGVDLAWLSALPPERRETAWSLRAFAGSLTATLVTAVYLLWRRAPDLQATLRLQVPAGTAQSRLAAWLVSLRWMAVMAMAGVVALSTLGHERQVAHANVLPLWLGVGAALLFNVVTSVAASWRSTPRGLVLQVCADVALLGFLVHHAGGVTNPFAMFFVFHGVIAVIVLDPLRGVAVVTGQVAFVLLLAILEAAGVLTPGCVLGAGGACVTPAPLVLLAHGAAIAATLGGCAFMVRSLSGLLYRERDDLDLARRAVSAEREKLQLIIDCMADVVIFADPAGRMLLHNRAAATLLPAGTPAGGDLRVCHAPETWQKMMEKLVSAGPLEEHPVLRMGGRSFEATYASVHTDAGALQGVVMVARDITERLEANAWRMREERMAVVGKLAATIAHEVNNPLGAIALFAQRALKQAPPGSALADQMDTVVRNAGQCAKIVRDLLEYARQRPPERRPLVPGDVLEDVARTLRLHADRAGIRLTVERDDHGAELDGDADQLRQVIMNLGLNGIEAMEKGGALTLRTSRVEDAVRLDVTDTGPGISAAERERIFTPFYTTKANGTGLGLAVAQDIVQAHGGRLELVSRPGEGTTFSIFIPAGVPVRQRGEVA